MLEEILVQIAPGELVDKITILEIKLQNIKDEVKLANILKEYNILIEIRDRHLKHNKSLDSLIAELKVTNEKLWEIEDLIREHEDAKDFGESFIELARSVYFTNDKRAKLKWKINMVMESDLVEEKSYSNY